MSIFRHHPRRRAPELDEAKRVRDLQFAEVDSVLQKVEQSVKMIQNYAIAEKRRTTRGQKA